MPPSDTPPDGFPALRTIAMPADTNANGDIFGGWLLSQMDLAGSIAAVQRAKSKVATVGIEAMSFHKPVFVGDVVSCYCTIERVGRTSIAVKVYTWAQARTDGAARKVTEGQFTYVAIGDDRRPIPVDRPEE